MPRITTAVRISVMPPKQRILDAAIQRFARYSYEDTGLRDIAADAEVDVAYVHRSFGSKEQLFAAALRATIKPDRLFVEGRENQEAQLVKQIFVRDRRVSRAEISPLDIVIRSLTSPSAASVLRKFILEEIIRPLSRNLEDHEGIRAATTCAFLMGVGILRNVLELEPLREKAGGGLENLIAMTIAHIDSFAINAKP
jgi:AcrR family transcriptional regulator